MSEQGRRNPGGKGPQASTFSKYSNSIILPKLIPILVTRPLHFDVVSMPLRSIAYVQVCLTCMPLMTICVTVLLRECSIRIRSFSNVVWEPERNKKALVQWYHSLIFAKEFIALGCCVTLHAKSMAPQRIQPLCLV